MRLIDADALREDLRRFFPAEVLEGIEPKTLFAQIMHDIDNAPTVIDHSVEIAQKSIELGRRVGRAEKAIESQRPQGEWIKGNAYYDERTKSMFDKCKCSICGRTQSFYEDNETGELYSFNFCPNCGAQMRGETDDG